MTETAADLAQREQDMLAVFKAMSPAEVAAYQRHYAQLEFDRCTQDGWYWVKHHVKTRDEADRSESSVKPFPAEPALEAIWNVLEHSPSKLFVIAKSRQIMASWITCCFALWSGRFHANRQIVWQTKKEDDAKDMVSHGDQALDEARMQFIEMRLPNWMGHKRRFKDGQILWGNGSKIVAVPEGGNQVRSKTTSLVVIDEAAYQEQFRAAWTAALPLLNKEARMIAMSTANGQNAFYEAYQKGIDGGRVIYSSRGLTIWENTEAEITSIRLHYTAFPDKDPKHPNPEVAKGAEAWLQKQRKKYLTQNDWDREMEIDFNISAGKRVFPEFSEDEHVIDPDNCERYGVGAIPLRRRRLLRAWDFGWHFPACIVGQIDTRDRLILYGELQGRDVDIDRFAQQVIEWCAATFGDWSAAGWDDYCDPAGAQVRSIMSDKNENTELQVLARYGIHPSYAVQSRRAGRGIIHRMLEHREDRTPALLVSRNCPIVIAGMLGGYSYKPKPGGDTFHEEPDDESYYSHTQACLRYMVTGKYGHLGEHRRPVVPMHAKPLFGSNSRGGY